MYFMTIAHLYLFSSWRIVSTACMNRHKFTLAVKTPENE